MATATKTVQMSVSTDMSVHREIDCLDYAINELTSEMKTFDPATDYRKALLFQGWVDRWLERRSVLSRMLS